MQGPSIWCDPSASTPRPYVPKPLRRRIFGMFHDIFHSGPRPTVELIKVWYFWPDMERNIRSWVKGCLRCKQRKISWHTRTETTPFSLPSGRFETAHIDIISPLLPTTTYDGVYTSLARYVLTRIDRATIWVVLYTHIINVLIHTYTRSCRIHIYAGYIYMQDTYWRNK